MSNLFESQPSEYDRNDVLKATRAREATTVEEAMDVETEEAGYSEESSHTSVDGLQLDVTEIPDRDVDFDRESEFDQEQIDGVEG